MVDAVLRSSIGRIIKTASAIATSIVHAKLEYCNLDCNLGLNIGLGLNDI